jgi:cupin 2 domain-containing protein
VDHVERGRLRPFSDAPLRGESVETVAMVSGAVVEQILSGDLGAPVEYLQDHDEWVVVLSGGATLVVDGATIDLVEGEWLALPRGVRHRLESTLPGTSWLAVHGSGNELTAPEAGSSAP